MISLKQFRPAIMRIAVGGGGVGGAVAPPFGSKRRKSSKIRANGLFIWANSLDIWAHHCQNTVSVSVKTFFFFFFFFWRTPSFGQKNRSNFREDLFFFGEHLHLDRKTVQISGKTFFFFFLENTFIWTEKLFKFQGRPFFFWAEQTVSILTEERNASSHFSGKSLLPPQIILSSYGHDYACLVKILSICIKVGETFLAYF